MKMIKLETSNRYVALLPEKVEGNNDIFTVIVTAKNGVVTPVTRTSCDICVVWDMLRDWLADIRYTDNLAIAQRVIEAKAASAAINKE